VNSINSIFPFVKAVQILYSHEIKTCGIPLKGHGFDSRLREWNVVNSVVINDGSEHAMVGKFIFVVEDCEANPSASVFHSRIETKRQLHNFYSFLKNIGR